MRTLKPREDIKPLSRFRANVKKYFQQVSRTHRPLIITQRGEPVAVVMDADDYDKYQEHVEQEELLKQVRIALKQVREGKTISHDELKRRMERKIRAYEKAEAKRKP